MAPRAQLDTAAADSAGRSGGMSRTPAWPLRRYVSSIVGYDVPGQTASVHHGLPSTALTVIIAFDDPLEVGWSRDPAQRQGFFALASGFHTTPAYIFLTPRHCGIQLALTPAGARAWFGIPAAELSGELVDLGQVLGPASERIYDTVAGHRDWAGRLATVEAELSALVPVDDVGVRSELAWAWQRLRTGGVTRTTALADEIGWGRAYFTRQFAVEFGLRPKETARIVRFGHARSALEDTGRSLADIASACGYADQAHLTREWHRLSGYTPAQWRAQELAFVQDSRTRQ